MRRIFLTLLGFLIIFSIFGALFTKPIEASFTYSHDANSLTVSYSSLDDFSSCNEPTVWQLNVEYGSPADQLQSEVASINSNSIIAGFEGQIPIGDPIKFIEVLTDDTATGRCYIEVANKSSGLFNWGDAGSSTDTTPTPTPIIINTVVSQAPKIVTPSPTPTPIPDMSPPLVSVSTDFSKPFTKAPTIFGSATDNKAVSKIEYSTDGGKNFLPVDKASFPGKGATTYGFTPNLPDDGNYALRVRATDGSGNVGLSKIYTLVIDRLSPQLSGLLFSVGPQTITPSPDGSLIVLANQKINLVLSEIGGSTTVSIISTSKKDNGKKEFKLSKNSENGLWKGSLSFLSPGEYSLKFVGVDGAENRTESEINNVIVESSGSIHAPDAQITVYFQEPHTKLWLLWDGKGYGQVNPVKADSAENYSLFLPSGRYYFHVEAPGYQSINSEFFTLDKPIGVNANFSLKKSKLLFSLGPIHIYFPDFSTLLVPFKNNITLNKNQSLLSGKQLPFFSLPNSNNTAFTSDSLGGKPTILTFINTWSPQSLEQISIQNNLSKNKNINVVFIFVGEKQSKIDIFKKRGGYSVSMFADLDAKLSKQFNLNFLPMNLFINRAGIVKSVEYGSMSEEEVNKQFNLVGK